MKVTIVGGCGRLGLSMAVVSAQRGHEVVCADIDRNAVNTVSDWGSPISESGVQEALSELYGKVANYEGSLTATTDIFLACEGSEMIFIVIPTPSLDSGRFDIEAILLSCNEIGRAIENSQGFKTVVVVSTVNPGDCEGHIIPTLEFVCDGEAGKDFGFVYSPEFIRQGSIMKDFQNPDIVLIGQHDMMAGNAAWRYYSTILKNIPKFFRMNLINAEITKLGLNTALVAKLAMANQITWLCHKTKGADAEKVLEAIGADSRIGNKFFKPGLPPGGPCLPRDARAFQEAQGMQSVNMQFMSMISGAWVYEILYLVREIDKYRRHDIPFALLGMTYKTKVDIMQESVWERLKKWLTNDEIYLWLDHDPCHIAPEGHLEDIIESSNLLVILTPHEEYLALMQMDLSGKIVFDCWGLLDESKLNCEKYIRLGRGE